MKKNRINQLEYFKKYSVRFGFDFISLKPKNLNRTGLVKKYKITELKKINWTETKPIIKPIRKKKNLKKQYNF
jgi:hypothetical protein